MNSGKSIKAIIIIMQTAIKNDFVIISGGEFISPK